jgi:hypothetical protein
MHGAQLIFSPRQGPAMELLRLQGGLWMDDSRVASYAVARWALCGERQCVVGDAVWHIDSSNTKTRKSPESDLQGMGLWEPRSQGEGFC